MLKDLINRYGYSKLNSLTKYPSILTLHKVGEKGNLTEELNVKFEEGEKLFLTEKIDGVNVRILIYGEEFIIGSREELLFYNGDVLYNKELNIVESFLSLPFKIPKTKELFVIYGELFGGHFGKNGKNYGKESFNFRIFDFTNPEINLLDLELEKIAAQRERNNSQFLPYYDFMGTGEKLMPEKVPMLFTSPFLNPENLNKFSLKETYEGLIQTISKTKVLLNDSGSGVPEGVIVRNENRSKIAKIRFEDYRRTLTKLNKV